MARKRQHRYIARVGTAGPTRETALVGTQGEAKRFIRKVRNVGKPWALFGLVPDRRIAAGFVRRDRTTRNLVSMSRLKSLGRQSLA